MILRRSLAVLGLVFGVVLLLYAGLLTEAHLEMRAIDPPLPDPARFEVLAGVADGPVRVSYVNSGTQPRGDESRGMYAGFLIEWEDGRAFLIDVGMDRTGMIEFGRALELAMGAQPVRPHGSVGEQMGEAARTIRGVGFTHLHYDHTAGMSELCAAVGRRIEVFQTPDQMDRGNFGTEPGREDLEQAGCVTLRRLEGLDDESIAQVDGFPGLLAIPAGGHTPGSTMFAARVRDTLWFFSGDITNSIASIRRDIAKPWVYSWLIVPESGARLAALRPWLAALDASPRVRVIVSHDLDALEASGMPAWRGPATQPAEKR